MKPEILEKDQPESSVTELYRNLNPEGQREVSRLMRLMAYMETFRKVALSRYEELEDLSGEEE